MVKRQVWGAMIWLCVLAAPAQDMGLTADGGWAYLHFHARNSPARNSCHQIARDGNGFFWLATQDGLLQFDGRSLQAHSTSGIAGFSASRIGGIWHAANDTLLVTGHYANSSSCLIVNGQIVPDIDKKHRKKFILNYHEQAFETTFAYPLTEITLGDFIATLSPKPIFYAQGDNGFHVFEDPARPSVFVPYPGSYHAMGRAFPAGEEVFFAQPDAPWRAARFRGTLRLPDVPFRFDVPPPAGDSLLEVCWSAGSPHPVAVFSHALYLLRHTANGLFAERLCYGPDFSGVKAVWYSPEEGVLLAGTLHSGLFVLKRTPFALMPGSIDAVFYNVMRLRDGRLVALSQRGWHTWPAIGGARTDFPVRGGIIASPRMCWQDQHDRLWASVYYPATNALSLMRFSPDRLQAPEQILPLGNDAHFLAGSPAGDAVWLVGQLHITRIDPVTLHAQQQMTNPPWKAKTLLGCATAPDGMLWIGTEQGVFWWDPQTRQYDSLPAMQAVAARNFFFEPDGSCWVASYGQGLFHVAGRKVVAIPGDQAGYLRFSHAFVSDARGYCWITTNDGLFCTPRKALLGYIAGRAAPPEYCYYNLEGLPSSEFNGGASQPLLTLGNGQVITCNLGGLVAFQPDQVQVSFPAGPVHLLRASLGETDQQLKHQAVLKPDFGRITFVLGTAYAGAGENVKIYFRLAGYDTDWRLAALGSPITYTALPAGGYTLETRILRGFDGQYDFQKQLTFTILTRWYQTWWARAMFVLLLLLTFYGISRWRVRRINWTNKELNRLVSERTAELEQTVERLHLSEASLRMAMETRDRIISIISHDMKTPLLFMARVSDDLLRSPVRLSEKEMREYLRQVATTTAEMHQWLNTLLSWMRSEGNLSLQREEVSIGQLVQEVLGIFQQAAASKGITLHADLPLDCVISGDRNWLKVMFANLIENSIKFSAKGRILITSEVVGNEKIIRISDEGRGMTEQRVIAMQNEQIAVAAKGTAGERGLGLGLQIVAKVVALHQGRWQIDSVPEQGTTVSIWLPYPASP